LSGVEGLIFNAFFYINMAKFTNQISSTKNFRLLAENI